MLDTKRLLDQFLGAGGQGASGGSAQGFDLSRLGDMAREFGAGGLGGSLPGGFGGGALAGGLAGILLGSKKGRKLGGSALQLGGMAVVGALAYKAYRDWQAGNGPSGAGSTIEVLEAPKETPFNPASEEEQQSLSRNLLTAMIAAAKADGHIDAQEQANIFAQMDKLELDADDKAFVLDQLRAPLDIDSVAGAARTPEEAAEIYVASLLAVDVDNAAERGYLAMLAARLGLDDALVEHLHATVEGATEKA